VGTFVSEWLKAEGYGIVSYAINQFVDNLQNGPVFYVDGVFDSSGLHLNFVDLVIRVELSKIVKLQLSGSVDSLTAAQNAITGSHDILRKERHILYHALAGAYAPSNFTAADQDDMRWKLREYQFPKIQYAVDHSINPSFSVSPLPDLPWKGDWTFNDRRGSLAWLPTFEMPADVYQWKDGRDFVGGGSLAESPSVDYLHIYWFARSHNLLGSAD
jgi:hypothetical protein